MQNSKPVIAAVSGYAVAGGLELPLCGVTCVLQKIMLFLAFTADDVNVLIDGGTVRLPRIIGHGRARGYDSDWTSR